MKVCDKVIIERPESGYTEYSDKQISPCRTTASLAGLLLKQPAIHNLYLFKEERTGFLMTKNKSRKAPQKEGLIAFFTRLLEQLKDTGFDLFKTLGKTLHSWQPKISFMFLFLTVTATTNASIVKEAHRTTSVLL